MKIKPKSILNISLVFLLSGFLLLTMVGMESKNFKIPFLSRATIPDDSDSTCTYSCPNYICMSNNDALCPAYGIPCQTATDCYTYTPSDDSNLPPDNGLCSYSCLNHICSSNNDVSCPVYATSCQIASDCMSAGYLPPDNGSCSYSCPNGICMSNNDALCSAYGIPCQIASDCYTYTTPIPVNYSCLSPGEMSCYNGSRVFCKPDSTLDWSSTTACPYGCSDGICLEPPREFPTTCEEGKYKQGDSICSGNYILRCIDGEMVQDNDPCQYGCTYWSGYGANCKSNTYSNLCTNPATGETIQAGQHTCVNGTMQMCTVKGLLPDVGEDSKCGTTQNPIKPETAPGTLLYQCLSLLKTDTMYKQLLPYCKPGKIPYLCDQYYICM